MRARALPVYKVHLGPVSGQDRLGSKLNTKMARCELGHQSESTFEKLRSHGFWTQIRSSDRGAYQAPGKSCKKASSDPVGGKGRGLHWKKERKV